ncbi:MAG: hypothetical protein H7146_14245 [Burkholderiaceae bacterium]|nr:hypothetical protein [Microbacteriaceae bacterium]
MFEDHFRDRVVEAAERVAGRTGIDPLDVRRSMAVTTDARLELLPGSIGIGLAAMAVAVTIACVGFLVDPRTGPGYGLVGVFAILDALLACGAAACVVVARSARTRRAENSRYEDAWARLAIEIWPSPRYQSWDGTLGSASGSPYSRTEFLIALRDYDSLENFLTRAPFTRMP